MGTVFPRSNIRTRMTPGETRNLGLVRTATTFKITSSNGVALSATNPGWVCVPSVTGGYNVVLPVTADVTADYDADFVDSRLGTTTAVNWANDFPYFFGYVNEDDTAANAGFFGTRSPCMKVTPAAGLIHDTDANAADVTKNSIHGFWADDAGKAAKPCVIIGAARMTITGADNKFVPTALTAGQDGIGQCYIDAACSTSYTFPVGQNGAVAANTYQTNADYNTTASTMYYTIARDGFVSYTGTILWAGAGAATAVQLAPPYTVASNYTASGLSRGGGSALFSQTFNLFAADFTTTIKSNALNGVTNYLSIIYKAF